MRGPNLAGMESRAASRAHHAAAARLRHWVVVIHIYDEPSTWGKSCAGYLCPPDARREVCGLAFSLRELKCGSMGNHALRKTKEVKVKSRAGCGAALARQPNHAGRRVSQSRPFVK